MQVTDARGMSAVEIAALMQKKAFDECELSPRSTVRCYRYVWCAADSSPGRRKNCD